MVERKPEKQSFSILPDGAITKNATSPSADSLKETVDEISAVLPELDKKFFKSAQQNNSNLQENPKSIIDKINEFFTPDLF